MRTLVTGASGYVGRAVLRELEMRGHRVTPAVRDPRRLPPHWRDRAATVADIGPETDWSAALTGVEAVVHLATPTVPSRDPEGELRRVVVDGTRRLAGAAARAGIRRIVFVSSVKAVGERTPVGGVDETVTATPADAYGRAKLAAEQAVAACGRETGIEAVVLRPTPVYGPGSGGNLRRIIAFLLNAPPVLPLGIHGNRRSFLHRDSLAAAISASLEHPDASGRTFFVADGEPLSTAELTRRILEALGRRALLVPVPAALVALLGASGRRLAESCAFDTSALRATLGWTPVIDPRTGLAEAVRSPTDPLAVDPAAVGAGDPRP